MNAVKLTFYNGLKEMILSPLYIDNHRLHTIISYTKECFKLNI
jgi:hypothetical protein